ncbi:hypothetical protein [Bacillus sp. FJAT-47783]|uniref:hypothetical protein n=1 Tax=Bacillus sp. FJAT-47783 TaxID=2922712 RepID=UPI001FAB6B76|nr:hypothetical protein [Bacillus sp. FJAT-47783]
MLTYIRIRFKYYIQRNTEFFNKILSKWLQEKTIKQYIYIFIGISLLIKFVLFYIVISFLVNYAKPFFTDFQMLNFFYFILLFSPIIHGVSISKKVFDPFDRSLLLISPLSDREIFLLSWFGNWTISYFSKFPYLLLSSFILWKAIDPLSGTYWAVFLLTLLLLGTISISAVFFASFFIYQRIKKGYRVLSFIQSILIGGISFIFGWFFSKSIGSWISRNPNFFSLEAWVQIPETFLLSLHDLLDAKRKILTLDNVATKISFGTYENQDVFIFILSIAILLGIFFLSFSNSGFWYREELAGHYLYKDWISFLERILLKRRGIDIYKKVQLLNLFRDRLQISNNASFFFFHYTNYFFIGAAFGFHPFIQNGENQILRLVILFFLFHIISRDAFDAGTTLFPGILKFDGDGKKVQMYRISGESFVHLYHAKIAVQRYLGIPELLINFIVMSLILKLGLLECFFVLTIVGLNSVLIPHLKTLPSYASPHFDKQHFTETDDFYEQEIWEDSIESRLLSFLMIISICPIAILLLSNVSVPVIYLLSGLFHILLTISVYVILTIIKHKVTEKMDEKMI